MQIIKAHRGKIRSLDISPTGDLLVSIGGRGTAVSLWTLPRAKKVFLKAHSYPVAQCRFSSVPGYLLTADQGSTSFLWRADDSGTWTPLKLGTFFFSTFVNNGTQLALLIHESGWPQRLRYVDLRTQEPVRPELPAIFGGFYSALLAGSPVDQNLALAVQVYVASQNHRLFLFRPDRDEVALTLSLKAIPYAVAISSDGKTVAVGTTSTLERFDMATGEALPLLRGHTRMLTGLAYLADGRLMSCSTDGTVRTWDHESGKCQDVRDWQLGPLTGICVARDGMRAAVGSDDGQILIWDLD